MPIHNDGFPGLKGFCLKMVLLRFIPVFAAFVLGVLTTLHSEWVEPVFIRYPFHAMLVLCLLTAHAGWEGLKERGESAAGWLSRNRTALGAGLVFACFVFLSVQPAFRVLSDETNLLSVSRSMLTGRTIENATMGWWNGFNFFAWNSLLPVRPFLFAFLTFVLHALTGFREGNPFILNFLILAALGALLYAMVRPRWGKAGAGALLLFSFSQPVVTLTAASGGYDLLALFLLTLGCLILYRFWIHPDERRFQRLWLVLLLLANVRYEGPVFFAVAMTAVFIMRKASWSWLRNGWTYALTPLLLLPVYWQRILLPHNLQTAREDTPFSPFFFWKHSLEFFQSVLSFDFRLPYASAVMALGCAGLLWFLSGIVRGKRLEKKEESGALAVIALMFAVHWLVVTMFALGWASHPSTCRLFLPEVLLLTFSAVWFLRQIPAVRRFPGIFPAVGILFVCLYHPIAVQDRFPLKQNVIRQTRILEEFVRGLEGDRFLLILPRAGVFAARNLSAVNFAYANSNSSRILENFQKHDYSAIYVGQDIDTQTGGPSRETRLKTEYRLEKLIEERYAENTVLRISRVRMP